MRTHKIGYIMAGFGFFIILFSVSIDYIGFGKSGIQSAQILGIQVGVWITLLGWAIAKHLPQPVDYKLLLLKIKRKLTNTSLLSLVIVGFLFAYVLLFISPMFFNSNHRLQYFNRYVADYSPIGSDMRNNTYRIQLWLSNQNLYEGEFLYYPPLYAVVFAPTLLLKYPANYFFITSLTLISMTVLFFVTPSLVNRYSKVDFPLLAFFFLTTLFSYGIQFEMERGQFNVIAITLCFLAVYIYHYHNALRYYAYLIFSIAIQIKLYPAIFILMFVKDWRDWKNNILRFLGLGVFNILLLLVLGWKTFLDFLTAISTLIGMQWVSVHNHSIQSYVYGIDLFVQASPQSFVFFWISQNLRLIEKAMFAYYLMCLLLIVISAYKSREQELNQHLLLVCTIGAMVMLSVSMDYKLPILAFPLAMSLSYEQGQFHGFKGILKMLLIIITAFAYSTTLFPFIYKPVIIQNNLPMLMLILTSITILYFLGKSFKPVAENKI